MTTIQNIMTRGVATVQSDDTLQSAAKKMASLNVGSLPVCEGDTVEQVMDLMGDAQVRRLAVIGADRKIAGIVALGDLATRQPNHVDTTPREISERSPAG